MGVEAGLALKIKALDFKQKEPVHAASINYDFGADDPAPKQPRRPSKYAHKLIRKL